MELFITLITLLLLSCRGLVEADVELDDALDTLACSVEVEYSPGTIVDIKKSVDNGAVLLKGRWDLNKESCISHCCAAKGCNLALFKTEGTSKGGNNCYLVNCGTPNKCIMVALESFISMAIKQSTYSREGEGSSPTPGQQEPAQKGSNEVASTSSDQLSSSTSTAHQMDKNKPDAKDGSSRQEDLTTASAGIEHAGKNSSVLLEKVDDQGSIPGGRNTKRGEECGAYGCDGSGVVAVVVVAAVCCAIIIVVGAVLLKKVVEERRRKKFRNVDYLINGMYT